MQIEASVVLPRSAKGLQLVVTGQLPMHMLHSTQLFVYVERQRLLPFV